jgi:hypothetical protein
VASYALNSLVRKHDDCGRGDEPAVSQALAVATMREKSIACKSIKHTKPMFYEMNDMNMKILWNVSLKNQLAKLIPENRTFCI